jgi:sodium/proline symporter
VFFWRGVLKPLGGVFGLYELLPAFLFSALVIVVVSLLTKKPNADMDSEFDRIKSGQV